MYDLTNGNIRNIALLGGEPLLNSAICEIMEIARKYFANTYIYIVTNGILLNQIDDSFWQTARDNSIWIGISHYPIKLDIEKIAKKSKYYGVPCGYYMGYGIVDFGGGFDESGKNMFRWVLDINGKQNSKVNFFRCNYSNSCITLKNGKLYTCTMMPHIEHFNKYFHTNIAVSKDDYIDIYQTNSIEKILDILATPIPFCRYCNLDKVTYNHLWEKSKKEIAEWT